MNMLKSFLDEREALFLMGYLEDCRIIPLAPTEPPRNTGNGWKCG